MQRKTIKRISIIIISVVLLLSLIFSFVFVLPHFNSSYKTAIEGSKINLKTPSLILHIIKGKADEIVKHEETGFSSYIYKHQELFGCENCEISYYGGATGFTLINAKIPFDNAESGEKLYNEIVSSVAKYYPTDSKEISNNFDSNLGRIKRTDFSIEYGASGKNATVDLYEDYIYVTESGM